MRTLNSKSSREKGYAYADAVRAIRLIAEDQHVRYERLCNKIQMDLDGFLLRLENTSFRKDIESEFPSNHRAKFSSVNYKCFSDNEVEALAKELKFDSAKDMVFDAQEKFELPPGQEWVWQLSTKAKEEELSQPGLKENPQNLKQYFAAIDLLIGLTDKMRGQFTHQIFESGFGISASKIDSVLDGKPTKMTEARQLELVRRCCMLLGREPQIKKPNMTPEDMLAFARQKFPQAVRVDRGGMFQHTKYIRGNRGDYFEF